MLAAVRVRGVPDARRKASDTMQALHLTAPNSCVLLPDTDTYRGMLRQVKDYVAYGEVSDETAELLVDERGAVDRTSHDDGAAVVSALDAGETTISELRDAGLSLPFRLSPPSKGYGDTKRQCRQGGSVGERDDMDELIARMV